MKKTHRFSPRASTMRRALSLAYEIPLVCAVAFLAAATYPGETETVQYSAVNYTLLKIHIIFWVCVYFVICWRSGARTLPMQTWNLHLETLSSQPLETWRAGARYLLAFLSTVCGALGFAWALIDPDGQFIHDRATGIRLVSTAR